MGDFRPSYGRFAVTHFVERVNIRQRQAEGIAAAKQRGVKFGRPTIKPPELFWEIAKEWNIKQISATQAAKQLNVNRQTFLKWANEI